MHFVTKDASRKTFVVTLNTVRGETQQRFLRAIVKSAYQLENPFAAIGTEDDSLTDEQAARFVAMGVDVDIPEEVNGRFCPTVVETLDVSQDGAFARLTVQVKRYDRDVHDLLLRAAMIVDRYYEQDEIERLFAEIWLLGNAVVVPSQPPFNPLA